MLDRLGITSTAWPHRELGERHCLEARSSLHLGASTRVCASLIGVLVVLAGCDRLTDTLSSWIWGVERHVAVISATPVKLSTEPVRFELRDPAKVVGSIAAVCLSLRGDLELARPNVMEAEFRSLMKGALVTVIATTSNGTNVELR